MKSYRSWIPALLIAALAGLFVSPSTRISAQESARQTAAENTSGLMEARLMRFPDVYRDKIVFDFGGDLWLASISGGIARRITTHPGQELFPKFSPDGKWIAFSGQYDGNFNVYVMPSEGGQPRQLTFESDQVAVPERMGPNNEVINWTPDGKSIVFLSRRNTFNDWFGRLFTVSPEGGLPTQLPVDKGGLLSFSPDGTKMVYNRIFRNFRTWKRYTGGMAQSIWLYDFKNVTAEALTPNDHAYTYPMWRGNTLYFGSDRGADKRMNLYSMDMGTKQMRELTHFTDYDMGWPSMGPDSIILENAGYLYLFDLKAEQLKKLTIYLPGDRDQVRPHWLDASSLVTDFDISPDGKRAAFSARGDVFTVPAKYGATRNITHTPGIREHGVAWSPDGKWLAYISDRTGEEELYIQSQDGMTDPVEITSGDKGFFFRRYGRPIARSSPIPTRKSVSFTSTSTRRNPCRLTPTVTPNSPTTLGRPTASGCPTRNSWKTTMGLSSCIRSRTQRLPTSPTTSLPAAILHLIPRANISTSFPAATTTKSPACMTGNLPT